MKTTTNTVMLLLTLLMYSLSTAHIALSLRQNLIAFFDQHAAEGSLSILNDQGNPIVYTQIAIEVINVSSSLCPSEPHPDDISAGVSSAFWAYVITASCSSTS